MALRRRLGFIEPMKAAVTAPPPLDGAWLYEVKFDGFRVLAVKDGKEVQLWSRNQKRLDERFPEVARAVAGLPLTAGILDGEVCALTAEGKSSFQLLQNSEETNLPIVYYVFDLLWRGAQNLQDLPLTERKVRLAKVLEKAASPLRESAFFTGDPAKVLEKMRMVGAEGAIAKMKSSGYEAGRRSGAWVKIKFNRGQEFVVVGYTLPRKSRKYFGALLLGYYRKKKLIYAGRVGTGFNDKALKQIYGKLTTLATGEPWVEEVQEPSGRWRAQGWKASEVSWVKPRLVVQVQFTEWTTDGILRHPSFQGLREDKKPGEVVRE